MPEQRNFLLGKGERLTEPVIPAGRKLDRTPPYTFEEARSRLTPMVDSTLSEFSELPAAAKPKGQVVSEVTLNPEYLAKSYYPEKVLRAYGLRSVGSKPALITPEKRSGGREPVEKPTTQLFVSGALSSFRRFLVDLEGGAISEQVRQDLPALETFEAVHPDSKIKGHLPVGDHIPLEIVLHASEFREDQYIIESFQTYLGSIGLSADLDHRFHAGGLCFLRMMAPSSRVIDIAKFTFVRAAREMPRLRELLPTRSIGGAGFRPILPTLPAKDSNLRVAIFDGGVPASSPLSPWVISFDPPGIGASVPEALEHGLAVTSAALFGSLTNNVADQPFANIHHVRVWDQNSGNDPLELYDVLERIKNTLETSPKFDFINLSLGPCLPVEDDDVHAWTAVLDEYLADGTCVATIAVGNDGEADAKQKLNRVQVPSDTVNGLSIGACNNTENPWSRAPYSSVGPGRSPGLVKPDLVAFGGCLTKPYNVVDATGNSLFQCGTSFAAPHSLRIATGVRAHAGSALEALAIRTLLIHTAEAGDEPQSDIGWGKVQDSIDNITTCDTGSFRVVYQGELSASKYLRAAIPLPDDLLRGLVKITATCCYSTEIDSAHPSNYTRSGLEITFRPNQENVAENATHAKSDTFFSQSKIYDPTEDVLRADAHKWETCLHGNVRKRASSLDGPVFDIHYIARDEGHVDRQNPKIRYALVVTVEAPRHPDLYDLIVRKYRNILEPIIPIQVPVQI